MIVLDASAGVAALLNDGPARRLLASESIHVPHLIDVEVASALRRLNAVGLVDDANAQGALSAWATLGLIRYAAPPMLDRVWALRWPRTWAAISSRPMRGWPR